MSPYRKDRLQRIERQRMERQRIDRLKIARQKTDRKEFIFPIAAVVPLLFGKWLNQQLTEQRSMEQPTIATRPATRSVQPPACRRGASVRSDLHAGVWSGSPG